MNYQELKEKASKGPFEVEFSQEGGYDCMSDAYGIMGDSGRIDIDLSSFGQERCTEPTAKTKEKAGATALLTAHTLNHFDALLGVLGKIADPNADITDINGRSLGRYYEDIAEKALNQAQEVTQ